MTVYGFNDKATAETLKKVAANRLAQPQGISQSGTDNAELPVHGNSWILRTPAGGIAGLNGDQAGSADCKPFLLIDGALKEWTNSNGDAVDVEAWNIGPDPIEENTYVLAVMVGNRPIAVPMLDFCKELCKCDTFSDSPSCVTNPCGGGDTDGTVRLTVSMLQDCTQDLSFDPNPPPCDGTLLQLSQINGTYELSLPEDWDPQFAYTDFLEVQFDMPCQDDPDFPTYSCGSLYTLKFQAWWDPCPEGTGGFIGTAEATLTGTTQSGFDLATAASAAISEAEESITDSTPLVQLGCCQGQLARDFIGFRATFEFI